MSRSKDEAAGLDMPDPKRAEQFEFVRCGYDAGRGCAELAYRFDDGPELVEQICFPGAPRLPAGARAKAFRRALELLHLVAGVSYYKAGFSPRMHLRDPAATAGLGDFLQTLYVEGLGEFGYVNELDVATRVRFPRDAGAGVRPKPPLGLRERALVAMGGGKDSLVGLDLVRRAGVESVAACVGGSELIARTAEVAGLPLLSIERRLAPGLAAMNRAGAWNGHVPVTAINSAILLCAAILYDFRFVVFSNERSANEATLVDAAGDPVNHQYSKSSAFERALREVVAAKLAPDLDYFSILRPFSELGVLQRFSGMKAFHEVFSSCNRNFHQDGPRVEGRWCRNCPKCRFAALGLAVFLTPEQLVAIQGVDLLDDPGQVEGFRALCALGRDKPFECVGEAGESRAALAALSRSERWRGHAVVRALAPLLDRFAVPDLDELLAPSHHHFIPAPIARALALPPYRDGSTTDEPG
ncbi:MAG: endonuclease domain-containing protein [Lysobacterales bacterium]|jgi:hypothetical protein